MDNVIHMTADSPSLEELKIEGGYFYLAHAYSASTPELRQHNTDHALWIYSHLLSQGILCYNPLEATHRAAVSYDWATDHTAYIALNEAFIDASAGLIVVMSDGWEKSVGVNHEVDYALSQGMVVWYLDVEEFDNRHGYGKPMSIEDYAAPG